MEKDLNVGDHGYARRQPKLSPEEEAGLHRAEEERPCSLCQHYKAQLEQQQHHTARLQREASSSSFEQTYILFSYCAQAHFRVIVQE